MQSKLTPVPNGMVTYGCDPEGFFRGKDGELIGSEKVLGNTPSTVMPGYIGTIVRDGVQFEIHPNSVTNRQFLIRYIGYCVTHLYTIATNKGAVVSWDMLVDVTRELLDSLSEDSRVLGCSPSLNIYGDKPLKCNPQTYLKRSAGGHAHFGVSWPAVYEPYKQGLANDERYRLPHLFDIFVGNSCVLLDRDEGEIERRENYGRAGEYRLPNYGIEYRTPSNFWLRSAPLADFIFGMGSMAIAVLGHTIAGVHDFEQELVDTVNIEQVALAIDTNNFELAKQNLENIRPFFNKFVEAGTFPLGPDTLDRFIGLGEVIDKKGLAEVFPEDPLKHWSNQTHESFDSWLRKL